MPPIPDSLFYGRLRHYNILVWRFLGVGQPVALKTLALNGNATLVGGNYIQLRSITSQAGSAFTPTPYTLGPNRSFGMAFIYAIAQGTPADGFAFVAQNTPFGPNYLGLGGSGLGSFTLDPGPAIAATFDYYSNAYTGSPQQIRWQSPSLGHNRWCLRFGDRIWLRSSADKRISGSPAEQAP